MKSPLDHLEEQFKNIFEGKSTFIPWMNDRSDSIVNLLDEINGVLQTLSFEKEEMPERFVIYLNPADAQYLDDQPELKNSTAEIISELASQYGLVFSRKPKVKFITRNSLPLGKFEVKTMRRSKSKDQTDAFQVHMDPLPESVDSPHSFAFLYFNDESIFPLSTPVTNLGRKSNNHIVFDDLRVSRNHAQIRHIFDEYVIFDTGSSGGTYVNGERITQSTLKPGDVISLAGVKLIFSEETTPAGSSEREITSKLNPINKES